MKIITNKLKEQKVEHFDPNGNSLGFLSYCENIDLRCQIIAEKAEGYYLIFEDEEFYITHLGKINDWPQKLYDCQDVLLSRLFKLQMENRQLK